MFGVQALTVAMLDDFLLVVPRKEGDEDSYTLTRGQSEGARFDELVRKFNVPPAIEKTQPAAFSTVWCGVHFCSKLKKFRIPTKKWVKMAGFFGEHLIDNCGKLRTSIKARTLLRAVGKFSHAMLVWPEERPCLYFPWKILRKALYRRDKKV